MGRPRLGEEIGDAIIAEAYQDALRGRRARRRRRHHSKLEGPEDLSWAEGLRARVWDSHRWRRGAGPPCTVFRVPESIREADPKAYEPTVVAIGPLARNDYSSSPGVPDHLAAMEEHKWSCVLRLLLRHKERRRANELLDECLGTMKAGEELARRCYSKHVDVPPRIFAEMLLLDGCFILHLLLQQMMGKVDGVEVVVAKEVDGHTEVQETQIPMVWRSWDQGRRWVNSSGGGDDDGEEGVLEDGIREVPLASSLWIWSLVKYDLLKLENQIPFFVVQDLFDVLMTPDDADVDLVKLALKLFSTLDPHRISTTPPQIHGDRVHHLLHLLHMSLLPRPYDASLPAARGSGGVDAPPPEWIPSATELQEAGVKFKRNLNAVSMLEVTFKDGVMEIPPLHVYNYSNTVFRNLMAFEQCFPVRPYVTSYALFMDCIMRSARDARLLHLGGIVMNGQSADDELARFFGRLLHGQLQYAHDVNYLRELYVKVGEYHESRWHTWKAALRRDYFGNPWVVVSVLAAVVLLLLTVEQAAFAALAYVRPPK